MIFLIARISSKAANFLTIILLTISAQACANEVPTKVETLYSLRLDSGNLFIEVVSHGCTDASDFSLQLLDIDGPTLVVTRNRQDYCRVRPSLLSVKLPVAELPPAIAQRLLQGGSFVLKNPLRLKPDNLK